MEASGSVSILECCDIQPEWLGRRKRSDELFLFSGYAPLKVDYHKVSEASKNRYTTFSNQEGLPYRLSIASESESVHASS